MSVTDLYRVSWRGKLHGQVTFNTFYYNWFSGGAGLDEQAASLSLINGFLISVDPILRSVCSQQFVRNAIFTTRVSQFPTVALGGPTVDAPGTVVSVSEPSSIAVVLSRRTTVAGRSGRGRVYMPAVPTSYVTDSGLTATAIQNYNDTHASLLADFTNNGITWSPRHAVRVAANPKTFAGFTITRWVTDPVLRNQRRRQVGVGV